MRAENTGLNSEQAKNDAAMIESLKARLEAASRPADVIRLEEKVGKLQAALRQAYDAWRRNPGYGRDPALIFWTYFDMQDPDYGMADLVGPRDGEEIAHNA